MKRLFWITLLIFSSRPWVWGSAPRPPLLLAEVYSEGLDPKDYLVSEKLDGVRAYWDGAQLYFRSGKPIAAPQWFLAGFPLTPMDGELWAGRGHFESLSGWVRRDVPHDEEWRQIRYMVFELPEAPGDFSARAQRIKELVSHARIPWLGEVEQFGLKDLQALHTRLKAVIRAGGEGLMLHRRDAPYLAGRHGALLKLKPYLDAEGTVVGYVPGKGRHQGRLGALVVEDDRGRRFKVGTGLTDKARQCPPALGLRVTYRYQSLTQKGLPRFPVFVRVRPEE